MVIHAIKARQPRGGREAVNGSCSQLVPLFYCLHCASDSQCKQ